MKVTVITRLRAFTLVSLFIWPSGPTAFPAEIFKDSNPSDEEIKALIAEKVVEELPFKIPRSIDREALNHFVLTSAKFEQFAVRLPTGYDRNFDDAQIAFTGVTIALQQRTALGSAESGSAPPVYYILAPTRIEFFGKAKVAYGQRERKYVMTEEKIFQQIVALDQGAYLLDNSSKRYAPQEILDAIKNKRALSESEIQTLIQRNLQKYSTLASSYFFDNKRVTQITGRELKNLMPEKLVDVYSVAGEDYDSMTMKADPSQALSITPPGRATVNER